ncbi:SPOR domain-containing protein [bacterium SCSIO 12741]|nr:SPOR domain-containing protein [bacterium SCSIO 12741]
MTTRSTYLTIPLIVVCFLLFSLPQTGIAQTDSLETEEPVTASTEEETPPTEPETEFSGSEPESEISDFRPIIGLSGGFLTYFGDLSKNQRANNPLTSNLAAELQLSFPLKNSFYIEFNTIFGKASANERSAQYNRNFESTINTFGVNLLYNFHHFLNSERIVDPYLSIGFSSLIFNSKTDLYDANGNLYHYWSDGTIRDREETPDNLNSAQKLVRDYNYETDIRESDITGAGYYEKFTFMIPFGAGVNMRMTNRMHAQVGVTYNILLSDMIDGVSKDGKGLYKGDGGIDQLLYTHIGLTYDLSKHRAQQTMADNLISDEELAEMTTGDEDGDGVQNLIDQCLGTPQGVEVDSVGCPYDTDGDGVPDYRDLELNSAENSVVDSNGVALTDEQLEAIYLRFLDSTGTLSKIEDTIYTKDVPSATERRKYSRYSVQISGDELSPDQAKDLLSEPALKSVNDGDSSAILVGQYDNIADAMAKDKSLRDKGFDTRAIVEETVTGKVVTADTRGVFVGDSKGKALEQEGMVFRIQVGAFRNQVPAGTFADIPGGVIGVKSSDGLTRYYAGNYKSYEDAASGRVELKAQGYGDCLVKAFSEGDQIPLSQAGATYEPPAGGESPTTTPTTTTPSNVNSKDVKFKIQLGSYQNAIPMTDFNQFVKLGSITYEKGNDGLTRYYLGPYDSYDEAQNAASGLPGQNIKGAFVVGEYQGKTITSKEALDLLK